MFPGHLAPYWKSRCVILAISFLLPVFASPCIALQQKEVLEGKNRLIPDLLHRNCLLFILYYYFYSSACCSYLSLSPGLPSFPHCFYSLLFLCLFVFCLFVFFISASITLCPSPPGPSSITPPVFVVTCLCLHRVGSVPLCLGMCL